MLGNLFRFLLLCLVKSSHYWCYPTRVRWVNPPPPEPWKGIRLILILNHTSLVEYLYTTAMPVSFLWDLARRLTFPVADTSLAKPQGKLLRLFAPRVASLSRKRDNTWLDFVENLESDSILIFMPEGRMKRPSGLDRNGEAMTVKSGICDLLPQFAGERMIIAHSGGLHHVMAPGQHFPRPFRRLSVNLESVNVDQYLAGFEQISEPKARRNAICKDMEQRRDLHCPG